MNNKYVLTFEHIIDDALLNNIDKSISQYNENNNNRRTDQKITNSIYYRIIENILKKNKQIKNLRFKLLNL